MYIYLFIYVCVSFSLYVWLARAHCLLFAVCGLACVTFSGLLPCGCFTWHILCIDASLQHICAHRTAAYRRQNHIAANKSVFLLSPSCCCYYWEHSV